MGTSCTEVALISDQKLLNPLKVLKHEVTSFQTADAWKMAFMGQENSVWFLFLTFLSFTNFDQMVFLNGEKRETADHVLQLHFYKCCFWIGGGISVCCCCWISSQTVCPVWSDASGPFALERWSFLQASQASCSDPPEATPTLIGSTIGPYWSGGGQRSYTYTLTAKAMS